MEKGMNSVNSQGLSPLTMRVSKKWSLFSSLEMSIRHHKGKCLSLTKICIIVISIYIAPNPAIAFGPPRKHYEPLENVIQKTELTFSATILSTEIKTDKRKINLHLTVQPINAIFGLLPNKNVIRCIFTEDEPMDPYIKDDDGNIIGRIMPADIYTSGSGFEFRVKPREKVILFLESKEILSEDRCRLLRSEPIGRQVQIKELFNVLKRHSVEENGGTETVKNKSTPRNLISFNNGKWNDLSLVFSAGNKIYFYTDNKFGGTAEVTIWASYSSPQEFSLAGYSEPKMKDGETDNYGNKAVLNVEQINFAQSIELISRLQEDGILHKPFKEVLGEAAVESHFIYRIHIKAFDHGYYASYVLSMTSPAIGAAGKATIDYVSNDISRARAGNIEW